MERKAHSTEDERTGGPSRMQDDLVHCSVDFLESFERRPAARSENTIGSTNGLIKSKPRVGIIGAGLAGLRCSEVLVSRGIDTTILEARDRIGGRVHQEDLVGRLVDMGPSWVHGANDNPIIGRAKEANTTVCSLDDSSLVYDYTGSALPDDLMIEALDDTWDLISAAFKYSNEKCEDIAPELSLKDFFEETLEKQGIPPEKRDTIMQIGEIWGSFIGDPWETQSLKWFWLEECLSGDNMFIADTHGRIIQAMAKNLFGRATLYLSTTVVRVESKKKQNGDPMVLVRTREGDFEFDEVVVTIPLGCLKSNTIVFDPALTPAITQAIENSSYSSLEKVFITFPTAFWEVPSPQTQRDEDKQPASVPTTPSFVHFLQPAYSAEKNGSWTVEAVPLSSSADFGGLAQPTLLFSIHGPCAAHVTSLLEGLSPNTSEYLSAIVGFFRPYYSLLPNYSPTDLDCQPSAALCSNWRNDELAGNGSYTNFKTSQNPINGGPEVLLDQDILAMRAGMPDRGIWLAGEHTAPFVAVGTSTGAYWSGEAVGVRILGAHGLFDDRIKSDMIDLGCKAS
ncbi:hypothetical protein O1611_g6738 [Lasiodiplodia mahajangana]|uniref:Uncharacterized protein n=1 Tax=Lasiodiplodia mahajangana TaxID=1108764 RepID=A0ACC2JHX8_9PEZI|nr:hypothetical protein O1611_g6738 [Lasiodiplodia mahajangana]